MIVKGHCSTGRGLGAYLQSTEDNVHVEILGIYGAATENLTDAIDAWRVDGRATRCTKPLYDAQLSPNRTLSAAERAQMIAIFIDTMGLAGHEYATVLHQKTDGRQHVHLVFNRIDHATMRAWSNSWNFARHEKAARTIERVLGLERVQGVHVEKAGPRPARTPSRAEFAQGRRTGIDPRAVKTQVSGFYAQAEDGRAFVQALDRAGYVLAQGDRRDYVLVDPAGGVHSLVRRAGAKAVEVHALLSLEYPPHQLPRVAEARALQQSQTTERDRAEWHAALAPAVLAKEKLQRRFIEPVHHAPQTELEKTAGDLRLAYVLSDGPRASVSALEDREVLLTDRTTGDRQTEITHDLAPLASVAVPSLGEALVAQRTVEPRDIQRDTSPGEPRTEPRRGPATANLRQQFREVMKQLAQKPPVLKPPRRRRHTDDTGGFKWVAPKITRRAAKVPMLHMLPVLWDTLEWLRHWDCNDEADMDGFYQDCDRPDQYQHSFSFSPQP